MIYQYQNSIKGEFAKVEKGIDLSFPAHIHDGFEIILVTDGELIATVDSKEYLLKKGECALIFPNQVHEFKTEEFSRHMLCIFSPQLVKAYSKMHMSKVPFYNKFEIDKFYQKKLEELDDKSGIVELKGLLYSLCAQLDKQTKFTDSQTDKKDLLFKIFKFVEQNYMNDCSLKILSQSISYNYVYLSKYFAKRIGIAYTEYVNKYRINEACYLLLNSDKSMLDIAYECGFDSLRSFNRNFKQFMGLSPSQYRQERI